MKETTESSSSLLIFRTALLSLLSQGAEHCSLDTRSTSGCDPCLRNPSSHNRPFPQYTQPGAPFIPIHAYVSIVSAEEVAGNHKGIRALRLILTSLKSIVCAGEDGEYTPFSRWENWTDIPLRHVEQGGGSCALVGVKGSDQQGKLIYFCFLHWPCLFSPQLLRRLN